MKMKIPILFYAVALCVHIAAGVPGIGYEHLQAEAVDVVNEQQRNQLAPPKEQESNVDAQEEDEILQKNIAAKMGNQKLIPPTNNALLQEINSVISKGASVPQAQAIYGLKSTSCSIKVTLTVYNGRSDYIQLWWINYHGNYVYYGCIRPGSQHKQRAYGTHPFVLADNSGKVVATVIMGRRNLKLNVGNRASW